MISIFFVAGMFGSSIEYMLRMYSNNFLYPVHLRRNHTKTSITGIQSDGSMHGFRKESHIGSLSAYEQDIDAEISTPTYPTPDGTLLKILKVYPLKPSSVNVLLYADSLRAAEINILFQYHKIAVGAVMKQGLGIFSNAMNKNDIVTWNSKYTHWSQMQPWEWREWMSLFYPKWVQEWINSQHEVPDNFLKISNTEMLFRPKDTITRIFDFCNVPITGDLDLFVNEWAEKQQYVIDEFNVLDDICNNTINNIAFSWEQLHIVASAIVQQRLRSLGYEIRCDGLNTFPTDSTTLYNLLERC